MKKIVDLTVLVDEQTEAPPSVDAKVQLRRHHRGPGFWQVTSVEQNLHTGSHIDASLHCFADGKTTAEIPLDQVCGMATILDLSHVEAGQPIEVRDLERAMQQVDYREDDILIVRTDWTDKSWGKFPEFFTESPYLLPEAAEYLVAQNPRAFGFDFFEEYNARLPSFNSEEFVVHRIMLGSNKPLLEQTTRLGTLPNGRIEFYAPFYKIGGTEGAPARYFALV